MKILKKLTSITLNIALLFATVTTVGTANAVSSNLIVNGGFESGVIAPASTGLSLGGVNTTETTYVIAGSTSVHPSWVVYGPHLGSNMMIVNSATTANTTVWQQTVSVEPYHTYQWDAWVRSSYRVNPAQLAFTANGDLVMSKTVDLTSEWTKVSGTWEAPDGVTSVTLRIVDTLHEQNGDDFAIDDISLTQVIPEYSSSNACPTGTSPVLIGGSTVSSTDPDGFSVNLSAGDYLFRVNGTYNYGGSTKIADAGYATADSWSTQRSDIGIMGTNKGVTSLLSDMGAGAMGVVNWGSYTNTHEYNFYHAIPGGLVTFVISDWYSNWYGSSYDNQGAMGDNVGGLNLSYYRCVVDRTADITSPTQDEVITDGSLELGAFLIDDDYDAVQWAVRKDVCTAATNTKIGNVDGKTSLSSWVVDPGDSYKYLFSGTYDVSDWAEGNYCFVFNPSEDAGESDIRLTRTFKIDNDIDNDGVSDAKDYCSDPATTEDGKWDDQWGTNRWQLMSSGGVLGWYQNKPKGVSGQLHDLGYTYGCNGHQILGLLQEEFGSAMNGHWKFGLSSSVLEDFHKDYADSFLDGKYYIETVTVPANKSTATLSVNPLVNGTDYILKARGTANAGDGIEFDARYSYRTPTSTEWTDAVSTYESYGVILLDLYFDGTTPWGSYDSNHQYSYTTTGHGNPASFLINDAYYPNNTGALYVDIYAQL